MMMNFKIILFCQLLFIIVESAKEIHKKELDRLEYLLERLEKDVSGIKDKEQLSKKEKFVEALNSFGDADQQLNKVSAKSTTDADNSQSDDLDGDSSTQSSTRQYNESSPAETSTTTNPSQPASGSTEPPYVTPTPDPSQSSNVSIPASGFGTSDSSEVELVKPLKSLLDALRKKIASHCAVADDRCGFHHDKMECCSGLRCSSDWSGTCLVDCVAAGQSCRQNWFCCDGRQCTKVATDDGSKEYVCK